jgi:carboxyl-terminal processing protease
MLIRRKYFIILPLLLAVLACNLETASRQPTDSPIVLPSSTYTLSPSATPLPTNTPTRTATSPPTVTASSSASPTPSPTASLSPTPPPTPTLTQLPGTPTPTQLPLAMQLDVFEELWHTVNEEYLYPDFNGLDWKAIHKEYHQCIEAGLSNIDFYMAMAEMIYGLGDDHSQFLTPEQQTARDAEYAGKMDYIGIGVILSLVPERQRAVIQVVFPGSPAEEAGMQMHDSILSVDGQPILDAEGYITSLLRGPEGTTISIETQRPGEKPRTVQVTRRRITGSKPVPYTTLFTPGDKRIGYILVPTFIDSTIVDQVTAALKAMTADEALEGLILDNRLNEGGYQDVMVGTLRNFLSGVVGHYVNRQSESSLDLGKGRDINGSQTVPMVVMVGPDTVSFGEIYSGILQDTGRAYVIGETTYGNVELLLGYTFADGSRAWIAHDKFIPLNHLDADWEATGIVPDLSVPAPWDLFTLETDPAVKAALDYFDK